MARQEGNKLVVGISIAFYRNARNTQFFRFVGKFLYNRGLHFFRPSPMGKT